MYKQQVFLVDADRSTHADRSRYTDQLHVSKIDARANQTLRFRGTSVEPVKLIRQPITPVTQRRRKVFPNENAVIEGKPAKKEQRRSLLPVNLHNQLTLGLAGCAVKLISIF